MSPWELYRVVRLWKSPRCQPVRLHTPTHNNYKRTTLYDFVSKQAIFFLIGGWFSLISYFLSGPLLERTTLHQSTHLYSRLADTPTVRIQYFLFLWITTDNTKAELKLSCGRTRRPDDLYFKGAARLLSHLLTRTGWARREAVYRYCNQFGGDGKRTANERMDGFARTRSLSVWNTPGPSAISTVTIEGAKFQIYGMIFTYHMRPYKWPLPTVVCGLIRAHASRFRNK